MQDTDNEPDPGVGDSLRGLSAIIAEDEALTLIQLNRILIRAGLTVLGYVGDGLAAVRLALEARPDIILLDVKMPLMNGIEAARRISAEYDPCIVLVTAFSEEALREASSGLRVSGIIRKPVSGESLMPQLVAAWANHEAHR